MPRPEGPTLRGGKRAEAQRADAAGDRVQGKGCPLSLGKKIFEF